jgi:hypothetical protein
MARLFPGTISTTLQRASDVTYGQGVLDHVYSELRRHHGFTKPMMGVVDRKGAKYSEICADKRPRAMRDPGG